MLKELYKNYNWFEIEGYPYRCKNEKEWKALLKKPIFKLINGSEQYLKKDTNDSK